MSEQTPAPTSTERGRWLWPLVVVVLTGLYTAIPYVLEPQFFQRGDTAAQFAPTWWHFGQLVREGIWPIWLDPGSWAGGNYVAEGLFGTYNPLNVLVWLGVNAAGDLAVATFVVKTVTMVALALGTYLLAREYSARGWAAALVAVSIPFSGFTLFWDAGSWPSGLMAFAYFPWVWLTFRRTLRGVGSPFWAFLAGALTILHGNPYGTLAVVVVGAAMVLEGIALRQWRGVGLVVTVGVLVAALLPLVYLPLLGSADLAVRSTGELFENSGKLRPTVGDLFAASSPLHVPPIRAITGQMQVPATYLAWFVLPLLPWLRWGALRGRGRELLGAGVISVAYLAMALGPSKLWLFRWPLRVIEYFYLGVLVVLAVLLSAGLARTAVRGRLLGSAAVVATLGWLTWSQDPASLRRALLGTAVLAALTVLLLAAHLVLRRPVVVAAVALAGVGGVVGLQVGVFGENASSRVWHVPSDVSALQATFADREGRTMQFADLKPLQNKGQIAKLEKQWDTFLPGSMYHPAGVDAVNNYTGMGFLPFTKNFCMEYDGLTQVCGYRNLWRPVGGGQPLLPDLMKLETIVVQPKLAEGTDPGPGWSVASQDERAIVLTRDDELPWPDSELSWASDSVEVSGAQTVGLAHERVEVAAAGEDGRLVFAMLGWPGWEASVDGRPLEVSHSRVGLLTVDVPAGTRGTVELTYRPPGLAAGLVGAGFSLLGGLVLAAWSLLARRGAKRRAALGEESEQESADPRDSLGEGSHTSSTATREQPMRHDLDS